MNSVNSHTFLPAATEFAGVLPCRQTPVYEARSDRVPALAGRRAG